METHERTANSFSYQDELPGYIFIHSCCYKHQSSKGIRINDEHRCFLWSMIETVPLVSGTDIRALYS